MTAFISSAEILARVSLRDAMSAIERAFKALAAGQVSDSVSAGVTVHNGTFHVKACAATSALYGNLFVAKVNSNFPENPARSGLATIQGVVAACDATDGRLLALLDSPAITLLRTAATTGVAIRHLARKDARVATVVGCGALGRIHVELLAEHRGFERVQVFDTDEARARELVAWARASVGIECSVAPVLTVATQTSDVVVTCTSAEVPFLQAGDVRPGTFVAAVGADNGRKAEIAASLLAKARIVTDLTAQCMTMGDLRNAPPNETFVCGQMVDVVAGRVPRTGSDEIVVFDSTGLAVEDLALCVFLLEGRQ